MARTVPYGAFNFAVNIGQGETFGGFSDVSGLQTDVVVADYRNGNERENHVRKVQGLHKVSDVTLKRGVIDSALAFQWVQETRTKGEEAKREVTIILRDEAGKPVQKWLLHKCILLTLKGPTLAGKGQGDVAMEELVISAEGLDIEKA